MSEAVSRRRQQTRDALITGATRVFAARGVAGASIEEICEAAGFTRGAFYSNFTSRDEVVLAIIEREIRSAQELLAALLADRAAQPGQHGQPLEQTKQPAEAEPAGRANSGDAEAPVDFAALVEELVVQFLDAHPNTPAWMLAEREIELYTLRSPELRSRYEELLEKNREQMSIIVGAVIERSGGRSRLPLGRFVEILASVMQTAGQAALVARQREPHSRSGELVEFDDGPLQLDPTPFVDVVLALIDLDTAEPNA